MYNENHTHTNDLAHLAFSLHITFTLDVVLMCVCVCVLLNFPFPISNLESKFVQNKAPHPSKRKWYACMHIDACVAASQSPQKEKSCSFLGFHVKLCWKWLAFMLPRFKIMD